MTGARYRNRRRGVLLLIVLGLLAMFGLVAVAFVVLTGQAKRSARAAARFEQTFDPPEHLLHAAALQVFRGYGNTNNSVSRLAMHSLLEDMYGEPVGGNSAPMSCRMSGATTLCGGQIIECTITPSPMVSLQAYELVGRVLTVISGPAKGMSTHIIGYNPTSGRVQICAFKECSATLLAGTYRVVVNGAPFSGLGFGFTAPGGTMGTGALRPGANESTLGTGGGANEDYDAVDFQNMLLAMAVPIPLAYPNETNGPVPVPIPSLHRPALINHFGSAWQTDPALRRQIILRPMPQDHPNFTGSNPYFDPTWNGMRGTNSNGTTYGDNTSWDVDNDGDGIADSIWVDLGMPVRQAPDGRLYKPLFAILCVDLDGRLDVNAHGTIYQADSSNYKSATASDTKFLDAAPGNELPTGVTGKQFAVGTSAVLGRGLGYGPAEVNVLPLMRNLTTGAYYFEQYRRLLQGYSAAPLDGRYGESTGTPQPGVGSTDDPLSVNKQWDYPDYNAYYLSGSTPSHPEYTRGYGSPADLWGLMAVGLDPRGQPLYLMLKKGLWNRTTATQDDPYEMRLWDGAASGLPAPAPIDNPFTAAEMERLLRAYDVDAGLLPSRLARLTSTDSNLDPAYSLLLARRHEFTVATRHVPVVSFCGNPASPSTATRLCSLTAMLQRKGSTIPTSQIFSGALVPMEMLAGQRMDLDRPWGDGQDNNNNRVVDEPDENNQLSLYRTPSAQENVAFSYDPSGTVAANSLQGRQLYARHLYVLMLLLMDDQCDLPIPGWSEMSADRRATERTRYVAQWAVNVVDFRDRDSIMTRFEYDPDPFDAGGWNPDGSHVVWGCERPELLLSEAIVLHDVRTQDLETEQPNEDEEAAKTTDETVADRDTDFDQKYPPQPSLFLELYNPWSASEPLPPELMGKLETGELDPRGIQLSKTTGTAGDPVWRILVVLDKDDFEKDPDDPDSNERPTVARSIYFADMTDSSGLGDDGTDDTRFYPGAPGNISPIGPGRYAVIGPGEPTDTTQSITYLGGRKDPNAAADADPDDCVIFDADCRRIMLEPGASGQQVTIQNNGTSSGQVPSGIQNAVAVVINQPRRANVTDPEEGYAVADNDTTSPPSYTVIYDTPLGGGESGPDETNKTGTYPNHCVFHLQRLANPLLPYNATTNPYRTIDSMPADLHTFNGTSNRVPDPSSPTGDKAESETDLDLATWERGEAAKAEYPSSSVINLWRQEPLGASPEHAPQSSPDPGTADGTTEAYLEKHLLHTLSYLNREFGTPRTDPTFPGYEGDPPRPFPWLTWLNRPFINEYELLLVPALRSSKLLSTFRVVRASQTPRPYEPGDNDDIPFPHLPNFFQCEPTSGTSTLQAPMFYRLLDFVGVPSPYVGTEIQGPPSNFANEPQPHRFHPPFNRIPLFRDPGRVNINTLFSPAVGEGLINYAPELWDMDLWEKFVVSRRGFGTTSGSDDPVAIQTTMLTVNSSYPTRFANPFRPWSGANLMPSPMQGQRREIDATLMRQAPPDSSGGTTQRPLFDFRSAQQVNDTDENPYFRYQAFQRMGNLVTTRSNVYAVWITVGYFEVTPVTGGPSATYPDGYQLGRELGMDTGDVNRHRAFYIFDRSIAVGFQRGKDLNVEKAIVLRRFIE